MDPADDHPVDVSGREATEHLAEPPPPESGVDSAIAVDTLAIKEGSWNIAQRFSRLELIKTIAWSGTTPEGGVAFTEPLRNLIRTTARESIFKSFRFYRFDRMRIELHLNANEFYSGHMKVVFIPGLPAGETDIKYAAFTKSGYHMMATESPNVVIEVPWCYPRQWMDTIDVNGQNPAKLGTIGGVVFSSLYSPEGTAKELSIRVLTSFEGFQVMGPIADGGALQGKGFEDIRYFPTTSNFIEQKRSTVMAGNHTATVGVGLSESGLATSLAYLLHQEQFYRKITWSVNDGPGTQLADFPVSPRAGITERGETIKYDDTTDVLGMLTYFVQYWSGAMAYHVYTSKTCFHTGKLVFSIAYSGADDPNYTNFPHVIYDFKKGNVAKFAVNPTWDYPIRPLWKGLNDDRAYVVRVHVHTPLRTAAGQPPAIDVNIFRLSYYKNPIRLFSPSIQVVEVAGVTPVMAMDAEYDELGETAASIAPVHGAFEEIVDLRQLTSRSSAFYFGTTNTEQSVPYAIPVYPSLSFHQSDVRAGNVLPGFTNLFSFWGGSMNFMVQANAPVLNVKVRPYRPEVSSKNDQTKNMFPFYNGCVIPTQNLENTVSFVTFSVPDIPRNACNIVVAPTEDYPYDQYNQIINLFSFETQHYKTATEYIIYYSTGPDFWFSGYRGFNSTARNLVGYALNTFNPILPVGYGFWTLKTSAHFTSPSGLLKWFKDRFYPTHSVPKHVARHILLNKFKASEIIADDPELATKIGIKKTGSTVTVEATTAPSRYIEREDNAFRWPLQIVRQFRVRDNWQGERDIYGQPPAEHGVIDLTFYTPIVDDYRRANRRWDAKYRAEAAKPAGILPRFYLTEEEQPQGDQPTFPNWPGLPPRNGEVQGLSSLAQHLSTPVVGAVAGALILGGAAYASTRHAVAVLDKNVQKANETAARAVDSLEGLAEAVANFLKVPERSISGVVLLSIDLVETCLEESPKWGRFIMKTAVVFGLDSGLLSTVFKHILNFANKFEERVELQSASTHLVNLLTIAVMAIGFKMSGGTEVDPKKIKTTWDYLSVRGRDMLNIKTGVKVMAETFLSLKELVTETLIACGFLDDEETLHSCNFIAASKMKVLVDELDEFAGTLEKQRKCATDPVHRLKYKRVYQLHAELSRYILDHKVDPDLQRKFITLQRRMDKLHDQIFELSDATEFRMDPFHICLTGDPGIGKGSALFAIGNIIGDAQHWSPKDRFYQRTLGMEFFDNYHGQPIYVNDEADQLNDPKEMAATIQFKSNIPVALNMANLSRKGMWFSSKLMLSNTNTPYPKTEVNSREAYLRRRDMLWEAYRNPAVLGFRNDFSHMLFKRKCPLENRYYSKNSYTFDEMLEVCNREYHVHMIEQARLLKRMDPDAAVDKIYAAPTLLQIRQLLHNRLVLGEIGSSKVEVEEQDIPDYTEEERGENSRDVRRNVRETWTKKFGGAFLDSDDDEEETPDDEVKVQGGPVLRKEYADKTLYLCTVGGHFRIVEGINWVGRAEQECVALSYTDPRYRDMLDALEAELPSIEDRQERQTLYTAIITARDTLRRRGIRRLEIDDFFDTNIPVEKNEEGDFVPKGSEWQKFFEAIDWPFNKLFQILTSISAKMGRIHPQLSTPTFRYFQNVFSNFAFIILFSNFFGDYSVWFHETHSTKWQIFALIIKGFLGNCIESVLRKVGGHFWVLSPFLALLLFGGIHYFINRKAVAAHTKAKREELNCLEGDNLKIMDIEHVGLPIDDEKHAHAHFCQRCNIVFSHFHKNFKDPKFGEFHLFCKSCKIKHRMLDPEDFQDTSEFEGYAREKGAKPKMTVPDPKTLPRPKGTVEAKTVSGEEDFRFEVKVGGSEGSVEGCSDPSINGISNKVYGNCGTISTGMTSLCYLGLRGHFLLTNRHLLEGMNTRDGVPLQISRKGVFYNITIKEKDCYYWRDIIRDDTGEPVKRDSVIISLKDFPQIPRFADITSHICRKDDLLKASESAGLLLTSARVGHDVVRQDLFLPTLLARSGTHFRGVLEDFACWKTWAYNVPTQKGMCGSPVLSMNPSLPTKIVGIHMAGPAKRDMGFANVIWQEDILDHLPPLEPLDYYESDLHGAAPCNKEDLRITPDGPIYYDFGELEGPPLVSPYKTDLRPSPLFDKIFKHTTEPSVLVRNDPRNLSGKTPMEIGINKFLEVGCFPPEIRQIVQEDYAAELVAHSLDLDGPKRVLTMHEAINGIPGQIDPMRMDTSAGFPFVRFKKGKGRLFLFDKIGETNEGQPLYAPGPLLQNKIEMILEKGKTDRVHYENFFIDQLKDERRPLDKIAKGKTRVFNMHNVAWLIINRMYLGAFVEAYNKMGIAVGNGLALNPEGADATNIIRHLKEVGTVFYDGDFSAWDGTFDPGSMDMVCNVILSWYRFYAPDSDFDLIGLALTSLFDRIHICGKTVYKLNTGMPSGHLITGTGNTIGHNCRDRCLWILITRKEAPQLSSLKFFQKYVRAIKTGDDNIGSVSPVVQSFWNPVRLQSEYKKYGITYTPPQKTTNDFKGDGLLPLSEISYLKRSFVEDSRYPNYYHAAMNREQTIQELVNWIRKGTPPEEALLMNMDDALRFAYGHGEEYFEWLRSSLLHECSKQGLKYPTLTYGELDYEWRVANELV